MTSLDDLARIQSKRWVEQIQRARATKDVPPKQPGPSTVTKGR